MISKLFILWAASAVGSNGVAVYKQQQCRQGQAKIELIKDIHADAINCSITPENNTTIRLWEGPYWDEVISLVNCYKGGSTYWILHCPELKSINCLVMHDLKKLQRADSEMWSYDFGPHGLIIYFYPS